MAPKAISSFDESTLPRVHIPNSDQRVLTVSEPCACSRYTVLSLGVTRNSTGSIGNLYPNFHFGLKVDLRRISRQNSTWLTHFPREHADQNIFYFVFIHIRDPKIFLDRFSADTRVPELSKQLSQTSYIYISIYRVGHACSQTSGVFWQLDEKRLRRDKYVPPKIPPWYAGSWWHRQ